MTYFFETYGCQMNKAESAAMEALLAEHGWLPATAESADLILINTCSVRVTAENRAWGRIAHFAAQKKTRPFTLVVTGCMAERLKREMKQRQPLIDYVLGNFQKQAFGLLLDALAAGQHPGQLEESPQFIFAGNHRESGAFKAYVPIMHGCNNFCAYCIVPYVRGREISRDPESILGEIRSMASHGVREIELLGQNVNSYNWQNGAMDFPALLDLLATELADSGIGRIRFVSSHPKDFSTATIAALARHPIYARHIHLCVQHGSDRVLEAMNRRYTVDHYLSIVRELREALPGVTLSTDILMGFPGESWEDVEATLQLLRTVRFSAAFMYYFNPREGTAAATFPGQITLSEKKRRLAAIIETQRQINHEVLNERLGTEVSVLVEGPSRKNGKELLGRTEQDMMAVFSGPDTLIGNFARVRLDSLRGSTFKATLVV